MKLKYMWMILNELLCLWFIVLVFSFYVKEDIVIGGKYLIKKGEDCIFVFIL